jgi:hypothetical protein
LFKLEAIKYLKRVFSGGGGGGRGRVRNLANKFRGRSGLQPEFLK